MEQRILLSRPDKKELLTVLGIFILALLVRLIYIYEISPNPSFTAPTVDSGIYDELARSIATGKEMNYEFFWQPFFYPAFLSMVYLASNSSIICAKIMQIFLGSVTCFLTYLLGRKIFNRVTGTIAGIIIALYGPLIFFEAELLASGWAAFWSVALILLFLKTSSGKNLWLCLALGICGALSVITRPTFLPFFTIAVFWLAIIFYRCRNKWHQFALRLSAIMGGVLLVAIPVAIQNFRVTGHFGILPASGGINFYVGNNPDYVQTLTARPGWGWEEIASLPEQNGVIGNMWEQQKYFNRKVMSFVLTEPFAFVKGLAHKTVQFLNSREIPRNVDMYLFGKWSRLLGLLVWKVGGFGFPFGLLLPLALLGLASYWRQIPVPLKLFLILYPVSIILVFVTARYKVPMVPAMSVPAAAGLLGLVRMIRRRCWYRIVMAGICGTGIVLLSSLPGPFPEEMPNYEAELYANAAATKSKQGDNDTAIEYLNRALSLKSDYPFADANLGSVLAKQGRNNEAIPHFQKALKFKDDSPEVHNNLASALTDIGKSDEAIIHYNKALEIKPNYAEAHYNLGNCLIGQGKVSEAIVHFTEAVRLKPDYFKAHNDLGAVLATRGRVEQAVIHFARAVQIEPDDHRAHHNLARALANLGRIEEAVKEYREALKLNPNAVETLIQLAQVLGLHESAGIRDTGEALMLAKKACELADYKQPETIDILAKIYAAEGRFADATATAQKALDLAQSWGQTELAEYFKKQVEHYKAQAVRQK